MNKKLNVGLVGCGFIGIHHAQALLKLNKFYDLKIIYERKINSDLINKFPKNIIFEKKFQKSNIPTGLDLLVITAPSHLHVDLANIAIEKVKTVIIEKPLGLNLISVRKLLEKAKKLNRKVIVVKQLRLHPNFQVLRNLFKKNFFGKINFLSIDIFLNRSKDYFKKSLWKGKRNLDGGTLFNQISHFIDLVYWIFGDIKSGYGTKLVKSKYNNEDSGQISIVLKNKVFVSINYTIKSFKKNLKSTMTILSEKGNFEVSMKEFKTFETTDQNKKILTKELNRFKKDLNNFGKGFISYYKEIYKNLVDYKKNDKKLISCDNEAFISFKNLIEINKRMNEISNG